MPAEGLGTVGVAKKVAPPGGLGFSFLVNTCPVSIRIGCGSGFLLRGGGGRTEGGRGGGREREREKEKERAWVLLVRFCKCVQILLPMCVLIFCKYMCPRTDMYVCLAELEFGRV
jgi:hypothetical protein